MIKKVHLSNFRNFSDNIFEFSPDTTVIVGPNAAGKTNILESVYVLATGKGFKSRITEDMITHLSELSRVKGKTGDDVLLEVLLTRGVIERGGINESVSRKKLMVQGVPKRLIDFVGLIKVVLFRPEDMDLVTDSPNTRRNFLNSVLMQTDREYYRSLLSYEKGLRMRNRLLLQIRDEGSSRDQLFFWDQLLIKNGEFISQKREEFIDFVNASPLLDDNAFALLYDKSIISPARLKQYEKEEVYAGTTLVGPHRDDFIFQIDGRELSKFGSRGQQRMGILWTKMAELVFIQEKTEQPPTLLLDDILSELDHKHQKIVLEAAGRQQTIITTADPHFVLDGKDVVKIHLGNYE